MERILLYYPSINIPDGNWLRNSLLYTDKVASIFPFENIEDKRVNKEMRTLYDEGLYSPISVFDGLNHSPKELEKFEKNFIETISSEEFKTVQNTLTTYNRQHDLGFGDFEMYVNKLTSNASRFLEENNLMRHGYYDEVRVEKISAIVYMSMLADYLACTNKDLVIPSTDKHEFERLAFQLSNEKVLTHKIKFENCLPTPNKDVSIGKIIKFKRKRKQELLKFRIEIDKIEADISAISDDISRKRKMVQFQEKVQKELLEIRKLLGDSKLDFVLNSFSSLLDFKQKVNAGTFTGLGVAGVGILSNLPLIGLGAGALLLTGTLVSSYRKINRQVEANSSSYIYYAHKEGILI